MRELNQKISLEWFSKLNFLYGIDTQIIKCKKQNPFIRLYLSNKI